MTDSGMALFVECPACETRFEVFHATKDHEVECPTCSYLFLSDEYLCGQDLSPDSTEAASGKPSGVPSALVHKPRCLTGGSPPIKVPGVASPTNDPAQPPITSSKTTGVQSEQRRAATIDAPPIVETGLEIDDSAEVSRAREQDAASSESQSDSYVQPEIPSQPETHAQLETHAQPENDAQPDFNDESEYARGDTQVDLEYLPDDDAEDPVEPPPQPMEPFPDEEPLLVSEFSSPYAIAVAVLLGVISIGSLCGIVLILSSGRSDAGVNVDSRAGETPAIDAGGDPHTAVEDSGSVTKDRSDTENPKIASAGTNADSNPTDEIVSPLDATPATEPDPKDSVPASRFTGTSNKDYDRIWSMHSEFILRMSSTSNTHDHVANGLIVDRRGWVLTSIAQLDRYKTANFASVFAPAWNQTLEERKLGPPTAIIRGNAGLDLCVVEVPAAAIDVLAGDDPGSGGTAEVAVNAEHDFAANTMMFAMTPTTETTSPPIVKCRLLEKRAHADVDEPTRKAMKERGIAPPNRTQWLVHDGMLDEQSTPCAIFSKTGELIAIHIYRDEKSQTGYAIRADVVTSMRNGLTGDLEWEKSPRLTRITERLNSVDPTNPIANENTDPANTSPATRPVYKPGDPRLLDEVKRQFEICDQRLDWMPKLAREYQQIQSFIDVLLMLDETADSKEIDAGLRTMFELDADSYYERISSTPWPTETEMIEQNKLAVDSLKTAGQPLFAYVRVEKVAAMSIELDGVPTVLCQIPGTEQRLLLPLTAGHGKLRRNSQWLLLGRSRVRAKQPASSFSEARPIVVDARRLIGN